jgi:hypothetical protein
MDIMTTIQDVLGTNTYYTGGEMVDPTGLTILTFLIILAITFIVAILFHYIFTSLTLSKIAKRLNHPKPWFAWIPFVKLYLQLELGDMSPAFLALYFGPFFLSFFAALPIIGWIFNFIIFFASIGSIAVTVITFMNICKKRGYDEWLGLLTITPLTTYVLMGILAWGKREGSEN